MAKKVVLKITGMHCTSCAMNIDGELEDLGVKNVHTNYAKGETQVEFDDDKIQLGQIKETIKKLGYTVVIMTS